MEGRAYDRSHVKLVENSQEDVDRRNHPLLTFFHNHRFYVSEPSKVSEISKHHFFEQLLVRDNWLSWGDNITFETSVKTIIFLFHNTSAHILFDWRPIMQKILKLIVRSPFDALHRPPFILK